MELYLKITAGLLLFVHVCHLAALQETTLSPGRTIDKSWLRNRDKNSSGGANAAVDDSKRKDDTDGNSYSSGVASGFMAGYNSEEDNLSGQEAGETKTSDVTTVMSPTFPNGTADDPESPNTTVSTTTGSTNSSQVNVKEADEQSDNSTTTTTTTTTTTSTNSPQFSNQTDLESTTLPPKINVTPESTATPDAGAGSNTSTTTTTVATTTTVTTTKTPEDNQTTSSTSTTQTTETATEPTTLAPVNTPEKVNRTDKGSASGSSTDRGLASDVHRSTRNGAWAAVLGAAVVVVCVGLAAYIILRRKNQKGFSHRKLVEEFPSDPVLRLDNSEPLDLNYGGAAYYNPALQGDNIQMTNFARHHRK